MLPIEVNCTQCLTKLRLPEEAAGKQGKCPICERVFEVDQNASLLVDAEGVHSPPAATTLAVADPHTQTSKPTDASRSLPLDSVVKESSDSNPLAPGLVRRRAVVDERPVYVLEKGQLDPSMSLQLAWELLLNNLPLLLTTHALYLIVILGLGGVSAELNESGNVFGSWAVQIGSLVVQWFLNIGLIRICLDTARGEPVELDKLFSGGPLLLRLTVSTLLYFLLVALGLFALVLPGLYIAVRFWPYQYFIIDHDCDPVESLRLAGRFTERNSTQLVMVWLLGGAVAVVGLLFFFVGIFFAFPLVSLMFTISYMMLTRQPIQRAMLSEH